MFNTLILSKKTLSCISFVNIRIITELRVNYKHPYTASIILDDVGIKSIEQFNTYRKRHFHHLNISYRFCAVSGTEFLITTFVRR